MQLGIVGLGRMGANIGRRLMRAGHQVVGFDASPEAVKALEGAAPAADLEALVRGEAEIAPLISVNRTIMEGLATAG